MRISEIMRISVDIEKKASMIAKQDYCTVGAKWMARAYEWFMLIDLNIKIPPNERQFMIEKRNHLMACIDTYSEKAPHLTPTP